MSGITGMSSLMKELKLGYKEDEKIYRQEANTFYDDKIAEMKKQIDVLHDQASKIGSNAFAGFFMSLASTVLSFVGSFMSSAVEPLKKIIGNVLQGVSNLLGVIKNFVDQMHAKSMKEMDAKAATHSMKAETFEKFYQDMQAQEKEAKRLGDQAMQDMKESIRNTVEGYENMVKAG